MKTTDFLKESFVEDAAAAHQDHEVQMARGDCYNAAKYAIELHKLLKNISEQQGLDGWVSEKITLANDYLRTVTEYLRYEQQSNSTGMDEFNPASATQTLDAALGESVVQEDAYDDAVNAFLTKNKPIVGKTHKPRKAERLGGSKHIGAAGGKGTSKGKVSGLGANTSPKGGKPVVTAEDEEEPQTKRKPAVVKTNKPVGSRVADIGPGGKEYNVKTDKAWDDQHKEVDEAKGLKKRVEVIKGPYAGQQGTVRQVKHGAFKGAPKSFFVDLDDGTQFDNAPGSALRLIKDIDEGKADPVGSWVVYGGGKAKRFKTRDGAKAYAEKNGGKVASSEFYADNIQGKKEVDEGLGKSIKRAAQGWGGSQDKPADIVKRNKSHDTDTAKRLRAGMDDADEHTPQGLQKRVLDRKLKGVAETAGGMGAASVATSMGGGNGFVNGGPGTIARPKMKKKK